VASREEPEGTSYYFNVRLAKQSTQCFTSTRPAQSNRRSAP